MTSRDIVKTLECLSDEELNKIQCYITTLKDKRKRKKEEEYLNELKAILDKASKDNIYFCLNVDGMEYPSIGSHNIEIE